MTLREVDSHILSFCEQSGHVLTPDEIVCVMEREGYTILAVRKGSLVNVPFVKIYSADEYSRLWSADKESS